MRSKPKPYVQFFDKDDLDVEDFKILVPRTDTLRGLVGQVGRACPTPGYGRVA